MPQQLCLCAQSLAKETGQPLQCLAYPNSCSHSLYTVGRLGVQRARLLANQKPRFRIWTMISLPLEIKIQTSNTWPWPSTWGIYRHFIHERDTWTSRRLTLCAQFAPLHLEQNIYRQLFHTRTRYRHRICFVGKRSSDLVIFYRSPPASNASCSLHKLTCTFSVNKSCHRHDRGGNGGLRWKSSNVPVESIAATWSSYLDSLARYSSAFKLELSRTVQSWKYSPATIANTAWPRFSLSIGYGHTRSETGMEWGFVHRVRLCNATATRYGIAEQVS